MQDNIGKTAGKVYEFLRENEETSITGIAENVQGSRSTVYMAIGWLAREENLEFNTENRGTRISLREN